jgi:hypothetical protein
LRSKSHAKPPQPCYCCKRIQPLHQRWSRHFYSAEVLHLPRALRPARQPALHPHVLPRMPPGVSCAHTTADKVVTRRGVRVTCPNCRAVAMMENARRIVSSSPAPPAKSNQPAEVKSKAEGGKSDASRPKRLEQKRKRLEKCQQNVGLEPRDAHRTQSLPKPKRVSKSSITTTTARYTSSKKHPLQTGNKAEAAMEQRMFGSLKERRVPVESVVGQSSSQYRGVSCQLEQER